MNLVSILLIEKISLQVSQGGARGSRRIDHFKLTEDTAMAVYHTSRNMNTMCQYLLDRYCEDPWNLQYLLLGKSQGDMLESHFGHMRKLCGSNYWTTVRNFLQSEAVIRKTNLLWYSGYDIMEA